MRFLIVALALVSACAALSDQDWENFQQKYGKSYRSADDVNNRRAIWENNWKRINEHNERFAKGQTTYTLGENQFADMTYEEFSKQYLVLRPSTNQEASEAHKISLGRAASVKVDLRERDLVTDIRDQGQCGACWAFATIGSTETCLVRIKKATISIDLSEQYLVDCSKPKLLGFIVQNKGCSGGQILATFNDILSSEGAPPIQNYPYIAADGTCQKNIKDASNKIISGVTCNSEAAICDAVELGHAVAVGIFVSPEFQLYKGGLYTPTSAENNATPNHAVLVIGYNQQGTDKHYIIKNSWGLRWGENGYIRLAMGNNPLKINSMAAYAKC